MSFLTPDDLQDIYISLPDDLRSAIFAPASMDIYDRIQQRYGLDAHQREELSIQSGLLMMGLVEPKQYVPVLAEKLGIPRDKAAFIAQEVNRDILHPVRESLKAIHGLGDGAAPEQREPTTTQHKAPEHTASSQSAQSNTSTLNQKLGGTFRVPPQVEVPTYTQQGVPTAPQQPRVSDPYRELPR